MRQNIPSKNYACDLCDKQFADPSALRRHKASSVHNNIRKYKCTYCDYTATESGHLDIHLRTHTDVRPFKCQQCDSSFTQKHCLDNHILAKHTVERPYECQFCDYATVFVGNLEKHVSAVSFNKQKHYVCQICGKAYPFHSGY